MPDTDPDAEALAARLANETDPVRRAAWLVLAACDRFLDAPHRYVIASALGELRRQLEATGAHPDH